MEPFKIGLIGLTNVGKSTLIEALLNVPIAPAKNGPATAVPVEYTNGTQWTLEVYYHNANNDPPEHLPFTQPEDLAKAIADNVLDIDDAEAEKIAVVSVKGPFKLLASNLVLVDSPGIGAAKLGDQERDASTHPMMTSFLNRVGRCYLCVSAGIGWEVSPEEEAFYHTVSTICSNVLVTMWEGSIDEQKEWKTTFGKLFPGAAFEFVNARRDYNVERLRSIIEGLSSKEQRLILVRLEVMKAWKDLHAHFANVFNAPIPWQDNALKRFRNACKDFAELQPIISTIPKP